MGFQSGEARNGAGRRGRCKWRACGADRSIRSSTPGSTTWASMPTLHAARACTRNDKLVYTGNDLIVQRTRRL